MTTVATAGATAGATDHTAAYSPAFTATYPVTGMSCAHCVAAVTEGLTQLDGVRGVEVDLAGKAVTVTSDGPLDAEVLRAAVEEAGYTFG